MLLIISPYNFIPCANPVPTGCPLELDFGFGGGGGGGRGGGAVSRGATGSTPDAILGMGREGAGLGTSGTTGWTKGFLIVERMQGGGGGIFSSFNLSFTIGLKGRTGVEGLIEVFARLRLHISQLMIVLIRRHD